MDSTDLGQLELFADLSDDERERLSALFRRESHPRGAVLAEEGDIPTKFFVILSGNFTVHRHGHHLADLGPGDFFGEMGVLTLESRNASVICTVPSEVAVAMGWDLRETLEGVPELRDRIQAAARARME